MNTREKVAEAQAKILQGLIECEEVIQQLYEDYSKTVPTMTAFWIRLAREEKQHAAMLRTLHRFLKKGHLFSNIGRFSETAIEPIMKLVADARIEAASGRVSAHQAVQVALRIETSLIDSRFYDVVESDAPEFKHIAQTLSHATAIHTEQIREQLTVQP